MEMFSKSKNNKVSTISSPTVRALSILSSSATMTGEINIEDDLRIDGNLDGNIHSRGKVVIGPEGCVKGKITGKSVEVTGKVLGDVTVSEIVILRASSYYEGQIVARNIEIEAGASFFGNCRMDEDKKEKPEKNNVAPTSNSKSTVSPVEMSEK